MPPPPTIPHLASLYTVCWVINLHATQSYVFSSDLSGAPEPYTKLLPTELYSIILVVMLCIINMSKTTEFSTQIWQNHKLVTEVRIWIASISSLKNILNSLHWSHLYNHSYITAQSDRQLRVAKGFFQLRIRGDAQSYTDDLQVMECVHDILTDFKDSL